MDYNFYGACVSKDIKPIIDIKINNPVDLYDVLSEIWCEYTCAPRLRFRWTKYNKTVGQCSITAFLVQDIFGGDVYGVEIGENTYHCFNKINGLVFDLTSEQFNEVLDYDNSTLQSRDTHFSKEEKYERYLYLKKKLNEYLEM